MQSVVASTLLLWIFAVQFAGIYLFTRGFMLSRVSLTETSHCTPELCPFEASYGKAVILIVDALRFDLVSPNPPIPSSLYHHNILRLPFELSVTQPDHSLLLDAFADPPTTTVQRITSLVTGSLPSYIDIRSSLEGYPINEDTIIGQLKDEGKRLAFMGDNTLTAMLPGYFAPNMSWPYASLDMVDIHTVDDGIIQHLFPLLREEHKSWDVIFGHFLGVDHAGHCTGPDHPLMKSKLEQLDTVLRDVVEEMDDDTLLIVLGDHGMDRKGDHFGDTALETSAALWLYSKGRPLLESRADVSAYHKTYRTYPNAPVSHRTVQQIDLVPSLSLLLGVPIPFNNLGTIIPELFWSNVSDTFHRALRANAAQIKTYLDAYRSSPIGGELDGVWDTLQRVWNTTHGPDSQLDNPDPEAFTRLALEACREVWTQFNMALMFLGLVLLLTGSLGTWVIYRRLEMLGGQWMTWSQATTTTLLQTSIVGAMFGLLAYLLVTSFVATDVRMLDCVICGASLGSSTTLIFNNRFLFTVSMSQARSLPAPLILHALAFLSPSLIVWEDRIVTFLLVSSIVPSVLVGFAAPTARLRARILSSSALFALCVRIIGVSTVCREEQLPYCDVTFYLSATTTTPPLVVLALSIPSAIGLPFVIRRFLSFSESHTNDGTAILLTRVFPLVLLQSSVAWLLEWIDSADTLDPSWSVMLRIVRTTLGWLSMGGVILIGGSLWYRIPTSTDEKREGRHSGITAVTAPGPSFLFWLVAYSLVYTSMQLTGQLVLNISVIALLSFLDVTNSARIARRTNHSSFLVAHSGHFSEIGPIALLGIHTFFGTGHQATMSTIQWKPAFALSSTMHVLTAYPLVTLNIFGPFALFTLAAPLLRRQSPSASVGVMMYYGTLVFGSAVGAAWWRRDPIVWTIVAPRFMLAIGSALIVDGSVLFVVVSRDFRASLRPTRNADVRLGGRTL